MNEEINNFLIKYGNLNYENIKIEYACFDNIDIKPNIIINDEEEIHNFNNNLDIFLLYLLNKYEPITNIFKDKMEKDKSNLMEKYNVNIKKENGNNFVYINNKKEISLIKNNKINFYEILNEYKIITNCSYICSFDIDIKNDYFEKYDNYIFIESLSNYKKKLNNKIDLFVINKFNKRQHFINNLILIYIILKNLNQGGSIILNHNNIIINVYKEIYYFLSSFFKKMVFFHDKKNTDFHDNKLIFICYKKNKNLLKKYRDIVISFYKEYNKLPKNIFSFNDNNYENFINNINNTIIDNTKKISDLINNLECILNNDNFVIKNRENLITSLIKINIETSIKWCIKNNVSYNHDIFKYNKEKYKNIYIAKNYFPPKVGIDFKKIKMSDESYYSVSYYKDADHTCSLIQHFLSENIKDLIITDGCANVGGNTISFLNHFKFVNAVEYSKEHVNMLENNINLYGYKNYKIYHDDYTKICNNLIQDIIFLDPPWGGPEYKYYDKINLFLSSIPISTIIDNLINNVKIICLKAPFNYDIQTLYTIKFKEIHVFKLKKYNIIIIKN